eukprot:4720210-Pyramimonas_sp.AAC.1
MVWDLNSCWDVTCCFDNPPIPAPGEPWQPIERRPRWKPGPPQRACPCARAPCLGYPGNGFERMSGHCNNVTS